MAIPFLLPSWQLLENSRRGILPRHLDCRGATDVDDEEETGQVVLGDVYVTSVAKEESGDPVRLAPSV